MRFPLTLFLSLLITAASAQTVILEEFPSFARGQYILTQSAEYLPNEKGEYKAVEKEDFKDMESAAAMLVQSKRIYFPAIKSYLVPRTIGMQVGDTYPRLIIWEAELSIKAGEEDIKYTETSLLSLFSDGTIMLFVENSRTKARTFWNGRELK